MASPNNTIREKLIIDMQKVLIEIRTLMNLSIDAFADRIGITRQTMSKIEKNSKSDFPVMTPTQYIAICALVDQKLKEWRFSLDNRKQFYELLELVMPENAKKISQKDWTRNTYRSVLFSSCIDRWYESFKYDESIKLDEYKNHIIMLSFRKSKSLLSVNKMFNHLHTIKKDDSNGIEIVYLESLYNKLKEFIRFLPMPKNKKQDSDYNKYLEILKKINTEYESKFLDILFDGELIKKSKKRNGWIMQCQDKFYYKMQYLEKYIICNSPIMCEIIKTYATIKDGQYTLLKLNYIINEKIIFVYWNNNCFKLWQPFNVSPEIERRMFWRIIINEISDIYKMENLSSKDKISYLSIIYSIIYRDYFLEYGFHLEAHCKKIMEELFDFNDDVFYTEKKTLSEDEKKAFLKDNYNKYQEISIDKTDDIWEYYTKPIIDYYSKKSFLKSERIQCNQKE